MNKNKTVSLILASVLAISCLSGCASDYPVVDRSLDVSEFIDKCFDGTGMSVNPEETTLTVSAVADRMTIDFDKSAEAMDSINSAIRNATTETNELTGVWSGSINIGPVIADNFKDIEGVDVSQYFTEVYITTELTLTPDGVYMIKFDSDDVARARTKIVYYGTKAAKDYLKTLTADSSLASDVVTDNVVSGIVEYVTNVVEQMLNNGCAGYYAINDKSVIFDGEIAYGFATSGQSMTLTGEGSGNLLGVLNGTYTKAAGTNTAIAEAAEG